MPKSVLIAANDPDITYLLQRYAERRGFGSVQTSPVVSAVNLAEAMQPALIILELDSLQGSREALKQLSLSERTSGIPVIIYTSCDQDLRDPTLRIAGHLRASLLYDDFVAALQQVKVQP
jgi:DNA-binding response OmpR family regulator